MAGILPEEAYNFYDRVVMEELDQILVGIDVVALAPNVPAGTTLVTRTTLNKLKGKAKLGKKGQPIPRETGTLDRTSLEIPEIAHGFELHRKDLEASQNGNLPLPDASAKQSARLVAESIEEMIFNGVPALDVKGIYTDAGKTYTVPEGEEWNTSSGNPYNNIVEACAVLRKGTTFRQKKLVLSSTAYMNAFKTNSLGISYADQIAKLFPNGANDIIEAPETVNQGTVPIPEDGGLLCDFGLRVARRYVEEDINLQSDFQMDKNNMYPFNVLTYQVLDMVEEDAFVQLENLIDTSLLE